jgi:GNAT superfamily N-acetyltransferase
MLTGVDDQELAAAVDTSLWARQRLTARCWPGPDARVAEAPGVLLSSFGAGLRSAFAARGRLDPAAVITAAAAFHHGHRFELWVPEGGPDTARLLQEAAAAGLTRQGVEVGMARPVGGRPGTGRPVAGGPVAGGPVGGRPAGGRPGGPATLDVRVVDDEAGRAAFLRAAAGFELDRPLLARLFPLELFRAPEATGLVGWAGPVPVTACWLLRTGAAAGVYGAVTAPEHRRRGHLRALLDHAADLAGQLGCETLVLQTASEAVFERVGFRTVCRYALLAGTAAGPSSSSWATGRSRSWAGAGRRRARPGPT